MHTSNHGSTIFIHNGDYSGDVEVHNRGGVMRIPMDDLVALVAEWVRSQRIEKLEQASARDVLLGQSLETGAY